MNQPIDHKRVSQKPLYNQIRDYLLNKIVDGSYPPHSQIPSESELGEQFSVSRITVRQALTQLQQEGLIFKVHGKGSFVSKPKAFQNVSHLQGFAEAMSGMGHEIFNQVKFFDFVAAPIHVAAKLKLPVGTMVTEIKRVRLLNRRPVSFEVTYLPEAIGVQLQQVDLVTRDIFLAIEEECKTPLGHADLNIDAILADEQLSEFLQVDSNAPILRVERLTHNSLGQPIDFEYLYFSGDAFQYRLRIDRQTPTSTT